MLLLLASCDSGDPREPRDGDRLILIHWAYADGTRQWDPTTFYDLKLETECAPAEWSDGHTYCTPVAPAIAYADADCSSPVGRVPSGTQRPHAFLRAFYLYPAKRPSRMFRATRDREPLAQYWLFDGTTCTGPFDGSGATYLDVDEVAPVRIYKRTSEDGRMRLTSLSTEDGLWAPDKLVDTKADSACTPTSMPDGSTVCIPTTVAETFVFRDETCTEHLAINPEGKPLPPVARVESGSCPQFFYVGPSVLSFPAYVKYSICEPIELAPISITHELAAPFPLASLEVRIAAGSSRLRAVELATGSLALPSPMRYDAELDAMCEPRGRGATVRCLPRTRMAVSVSYYTTPTCDEAMTFLKVTRTPCDPPTRFALHAGEIRTLSEPYTGPVYQRRDAVTCEPFEPPGDIYATSTLVPDEMFVEARRE